MYKTSKIWAVLWFHYKKHNLNHNLESSGVWWRKTFLFSRLWHSFSLSDILSLCSSILSTESMRLYNNSLNDLRFKTIFEFCPFSRKICCSKRLLAWVKGAETSTKCFFFSLGSQQQSYPLNKLPLHLWSWKFASRKGLQVNLNYFAK